MFHHRRKEERKEDSKTQREKEATMSFESTEAGTTTVSTPCGKLRPVGLGLRIFRDGSEATLEQTLST